jgi:hypothetical protein
MKSRTFPCSLAASWLPVFLREAVPARSPASATQSPAKSADTAAAGDNSPIRFGFRPIDFKLDSCETPERHAPETMAGGVAVFDYNNDGKLDIFFFFTNGADIKTLHKTSCPWPDILRRLPILIWMERHLRFAGACSVFVGATESDSGAAKLRVLQPQWNEVSGPDSGGWTDDATAFPTPGIGHRRLKWRRSARRGGNRDECAGGDLDQPESGQQSLDRVQAAGNQEQPGRHRSEDQIDH